MIGRVLNAYRIELIKAGRNWQTYIGPLAALAGVAVAFAVHPIERDGQSDYAFIAYAAPLTINVLGFFVLLLYTSGLVSNELAARTVRVVLVQPIRRREWLLAKFLTGLTYAFAISTFAAAAIWAGAALRGDLGGVRFGGEMLFTDREMTIAFAAAVLFGLLPQAALVALVLFLSTCFRSTTVAASLALTAWLLVETVKYPLHIERFVFFTYLEWPWEVFADRCDAIDTTWLPNAQMAAAISLGTAAIFLAAAVVVLARKDIST